MGWDRSVMVSAISWVSRACSDLLHGMPSAPHRVPLTLCVAGAPRLRGHSHRATAPSAPQGCCFLQALPLPAFCCLMFGSPAGGCLGWRLSCCPPSPLGVPPFAVDAPGLGSGSQQASPHARWHFTNLSCFPSAAQLSPCVTASSSQG